MDAPPRAENLGSMGLRDRFAWVLITAAALAAMVAGHAVELWLESAHALGDNTAPYRHAAQSPATETAIVLFLLFAAACVYRVIAHVTRRERNGDLVLPALHLIAAGGFTRVAPRLAAVQLLALFVTELGEQRLSGFHGNALSAIAGPGHASALVVHLLIAALVTFALCRFARFATSRSSELIEAVAAFLRRAFAPASIANTGSRLVSAACLFARRPSLLALGLANRPPPHASVSCA